MESLSSRSWALAPNDDRSRSRSSGTSSKRSIRDEEEENLRQQKAIRACLATALVLVCLRLFYRHHVYKNRQLESYRYLIAQAKQQERLARQPLAVRLGYLLVGCALFSAFCFYVMRRLERRHAIKEDLRMRQWWIITGVFCLISVTIAYILMNHPDNPLVQLMTESGKVGKGGGGWSFGPNWSVVLGLVLAAGANPVLQRMRNYASGIYDPVPGANQFNAQSLPNTQFNWGEPGNNYQGQARSFQGYMQPEPVGYQGYLPDANQQKSNDDFNTLKSTHEINHHSRHKHHK